MLQPRKAELSTSGTGKATRYILRHAFLVFFLYLFYLVGLAVLNNLFPMSTFCIVNVRAHLFLYILVGISFL